MIYSNLFNRLLILIVFVAFFIGCKKDRISAHSFGNVGGDISDITDIVTPKVSNIYFFIENSGSILGYLSGTSNYRKVLSKLATKEEFGKVPYQFMLVNGQESSLKVNNIGTTAQQLSSHLTSAGFKVGNPTSSDLNAMFNLAMGKVKTSEISVLISDGIYDIGAGGSVALIAAGGITKQKFISALEKNNQLQCLLIKLSSEFNGTYHYASKSGSRPINHNRPYYIWIFGNSKVLNHYFSDSHLTQLDGFQNYHRFYTLQSISDLKYEIHSAFNKQGSFRISKHNKTEIINAEKAKNNKFSFSVAVDFSNIPLSERFLQDKLNYSISNSSNYIIEEINKINDTQKDQIFLKTATHIITVSTNGFVAGKLNLKLNYGLPKWITETNADNETNLNDGKTYGFQHLIKGMDDAFEFINKDHTLPEIKITITK